MVHSGVSFKQVQTQGSKDLTLGVRANPPTWRRTNNHQPNWPTNSSAQEMLPAIITSATRMMRQLQVKWAFFERENDHDVQSDQTSGRPALGFGSVDPRTAFAFRSFGVPLSRLRRVSLIERVGLPTESGCLRDTVSNLTEKHQEKSMTTSNYVPRRGCRVGRDTHQLGRHSRRNDDRIGNVFPAIDRGGRGWHVHPGTS